MGRICHTGLPQIISQILGQETEFLGKHIVSPRDNLISFPSSRSQFSGVPSLGRGKGTKEEAGISLLGLPEQSVTDSVACTTEINFLLLKNNF